YSLEFTEPYNWQLVLISAELRDQGTYECQISTNPPKIRQVYLQVNVPRVEIYDGRGAPVKEHVHYEVGSSIDLQCVATHVADKDIIWSRSGMRIQHQPKAGISVLTAAEEAAFAAHVTEILPQEAVTTSLPPHLQRGEEGDDVSTSLVTEPAAELVMGDSVLWLRISKASVTDAGNYNCSAPEADVVTVRIYVLKD
ncbi:unnamed protein product, partial [Meganyctiphanes norvegica]